MPKAKTLRQKAREWAEARYDPMIVRGAGIAGFEAGHRANRLTKAERAVVEAAIAWDKGVDIAPLLRALNALERAKGRK